MSAPGLLLVVTVAVVGVLHTIVPDHWVPIILLARQRGWSRAETARAALQAGTGHVVTTLIIGLVVWAAGAAFAMRFGHVVDTVASVALIAFGSWIAVSAWRDLRGSHGHSHGLFGGHRHHGGRDHHVQAGGHVHGPELQHIDTGQGMAELSIFEDGIPPHFRFTGPAVDWVRVETQRDDGARQLFAFANRGGYWESLDEIPEPHGFAVAITLGHGDHDHIYTTHFAEHAHEPHGHDQSYHHHVEDTGVDPLYVPLRGAAVLTRHAHVHRHSGMVHVHWHDHEARTAHELTTETNTTPPLHAHKHKTSARMALLVILGSSPMVEGIPAFFAASRYGFALIALMAVVFAASTIITYVVLCTYSAAALQRLELGPLERYGEVISGAFIAVVGVVFWAWPLI